MITTASIISIALLFGGIGIGFALAYLLLRKNSKLSSALIDQTSLAERVQELEFDHQLLLMAQDTILIVLNEQSQITLVNNAAKDFLNRQNLLHKDYHDCIKIPEIVTLIEQSLETRQPIQSQLHLTLDSTSYHSGEERYLIVKITPIEDEAHHTSVIIQDVTEAERNDQIRKDFVANASHELRTPLAIINGYVETLQDPEVLKDQETSQYFLGIMNKHGLRLSRIIEEMLIITKLESGGKSTLNLEPFRIRDCIDECLSHLDQLIKEKHSEVIIEMDEPHLSIEADRFYWSQILFNLVENAIKQNPERLIRIKFHCHILPESQEIVLSISDNGIGIPSTDLPFIFRRFYRVSKSHSQQKIKGTGLGLSIVKRAVEAHGGTIECDSIQNEETSFSITLPATMRIPDIEDDEHTS